MLIVYKFFGFDIHTAKHVRLFMHLFFFIIPLLLVLRCFFPVKQALILLIITCLSPTILYMNTLQTSYGVDLTYIPFCILLSISVRPEKKMEFALLSMILWFTAMIASMSYPPFLLYLPFLFIVYLMTIRKERKRPSNSTGILLISLTAFVLPLLTAFLYLKDFSILLKDPISGDGIFRGGGGLTLDSTYFKASLKSTLKDLFISGNTYYFEIQNVEFSNPIVAIAVIVVLSGSVFLLFKRKDYRIPLLLAFFLLWISLLLPNLSKGLPGIRRCTGLILSFYCLFILFIHSIMAGSEKSRNIRFIGIIICVLFLGHHTGAYFKNLTHFNKLSAYSDITWFTVKGVPRESLKYWATQSDGKNPDIYLKCIEADSNLPLPCRYAEIYAAITGYRKWNNMENRPVFGYDLSTKKFIPLSIKLWEEYYFPH